jgi:NAD(P)-dependent dehydrogenase (short-subunit alcohol dehydrogenase family)
MILVNFFLTKVITYQITFTGTILMNKTAIITGSSRGIGRATAIKLAESGYNVCINCIERIDLAEELVRELEYKGCRSLAFQADVADRKQVDDMVAKVADTSLLNSSFSEIIVGIVILMLVACEFFIHYSIKFRHNKKEVKA